MFFQSAWTVIFISLISHSLLIRVGIENLMQLVPHLNKLILNWEKILLSVHLWSEHYKCHYLRPFCIFRFVDFGFADLKFILEGKILKEAKFEKFEKRLKYLRCRNKENPFPHSEGISTWFIWSDLVREQEVVPSFDVLLTFLCLPWEEMFSCLQTHTLYLCSTFFSLQKRCTLTQTIAYMLTNITFHIKY